MKIPQDKINKIVLFFANHYIVEEINTLEDEQQRVALSLNYYTKLHPFTQGDISLLKELNEHLKVMLDVDLSYQVFGFEVLALWSRDIPKAQRPFLNIKDTMLQRGITYYMEDLIRLKHKNGFIYKEKKEIVTVSSEKAKEFYAFLCNFELESVV